MFKKATVFILGAGASAHYGYPTGEELVRRVILKSEIAGGYFRNSSGEPVAHMPQFVRTRMQKTASPPVDQSNAWREAWQACQKLGTRLRAVDPLVIDYFLGQNVELQDLGRLLITWVIRECETNFKKNQDHVVITPNKNWICFILHRLVVGCDVSSQLLENDVRFITFNYDMSLEDGIERGLRNISFFTPQDVSTFLGESRFSHVYGMIRDIANPQYVPLMPLQMANGRIDPSFAKGFFDDLDVAAKGIRTIDPHDKTDEETLKKFVPQSNAQSAYTFSDLDLIGEIATAFH